MKRYLFGEAEAARGSALNGTDGAGKTTTPPVPGPPCNGGDGHAKALGRAHPGHFEGAP